MLPSSGNWAISVRAVIGPMPGTEVSRSSVARQAGEPRTSSSISRSMAARALGGLLGKWWDIQTVANGQAALDAVAVRKPDLVLTYVIVAGPDGTRLVALLLRRIPG